MTLTAQVYDFNLKQTFSQDAKVKIEANESKRVLTVPPFPAEPASAVYFVKLSLRDQAGKEVSSNFYWLPARPSKLDWDKTPDTAFTPIGTFDDMTALNRLPLVRLQATANVEKSTVGDLVRVTLHNPSQNLAFQVHAGVLKTNSEEESSKVVEDNYLALMPGESRALRAQYLKKEYSERAPG